MSAPAQPVILKCTSADALARIPIQRLGDGPGAGLAAYCWLIHESHEVGDPPGGAYTLTASGHSSHVDKLDAIGGSAALTQRLLDSSVNVSFNIDRADTVWVYVGAVNLHRITAFLGSIAVAGIDAGAHPNVGGVSIQAKVTGWGRTPPDLADILADPIGVLSTLTGFDTVGTIGDHVTTPATGEYGFDIDAVGPALFHLFCDIAGPSMGISLDVDYQTNVVLSAFGVVEA